MLLLQITKRKPGRGGEKKHNLKTKKEKKNDNILTSNIHRHKVCTQWGKGKPSCFWSFNSLNFLTVGGFHNVNSANENKFSLIYETILKNILL